MKLNNKRTFLVGLAFMSICAFWQMYDAIVPLILTGTFKLNESVSGFLMSLDNIVALFLLPLFGGLSDKCTSKMGRRKPFILQDEEGNRTEEAKRLYAEGIIDYGRGRG